MSSKVYKVNTAHNVVELIEADRVDLDLNMNRVVFYLEDVPVGSFSGYMSFCVHNPELASEIEAAAVQQ